MDECVAEFIDGTWTTDCDCADCQQSGYNAVEAEVEAGCLTDEQALDLHYRSGAL